jgi:ribose transport system substrate-binding protein
MHRSLPAILAAGVGAAVVLSAAGSALAQDKEGYRGVPRTFLWANGPIEFSDTAQYKKEPPYVIGFSNASVSNIWRVGMAHAIEAAAARHADQIEKLIITDANDDPAKQAADIQDLMERDVDLLIVSPATAQALDPAVTRAMSRGIPVILVDRRVTSDNFVSFVTATDWALARFTAQWLVEKLNFEGNLVMLPGLAGSSPAENRIQAAREVFDKYPGIKILELQYTDWSPAKGKQVMSALIQKYGDQIDGVWSDHGLQGSGAIEAFVAAGYGKGEIPPNTCADLNACVKLAVEHEVPVINFDYPPSMGADSVDLALEVLAGNPVPKIFEVNVDVIVSKGHETASVKADKWVEDYAQMDKPGELILSTGLGPDYDPSTFKVDYPQ